MVKTCGAECGSVGPWHLVGVRTEGSSESESGVAQLCPTLCNPMDCSLTGCSPWDFPGKTTGVGRHFLLQGIFLTQG